MRHVRFAGARSRSHRLTRRGQELSSSYAAPMTVWPVVALFYLLMTLPLTRLAQYLEARWRVR